MYSYRDPNPENTLNIMNGALKWARERRWTARELEEAKLSVFQSVDAPQSVNQEGMERFLMGIEFEMEQRRREWLLDVSTTDVREAAGRLAEQIDDKASVALLGERKPLVLEADGWNVKDMGMASASEAEEGEEVELSERGTVANVADSAGARA